MAEKTKRKFAGSAKRWRGMHHSQPGDPPFVQTGHLRRSITFNVSSDRVLIGSSLQPEGSDHSYAWYLEMGTTKMEARPYLRPALDNNREAIKRILGLT